MFEENPPRVLYEPTPLGRSLSGPMDAVCAWAAENLEPLPAARAARAQEDGPEPV